uniref:Uncharacterized protein n=1 Tax=Romanomermis culicivorax TaxID=13658 RepID=A0A915K2D7_ROMCU
MHISHQKSPENVEKCQLLVENGADLACAEVASAKFAGADMIRRRSGRVELLRTDTASNESSTINYEQALQTAHHMIEPTAKSAQCYDRVSL